MINIPKKLHVGPIGPTWSPPLTFCVGLRTLRNTLS
jgi:hypothetical protein